MDNSTNSLHILQRFLVFLIFCNFFCLSASIVVCVILYSDCLLTIERAFLVASGLSSRNRIFCKFCVIAKILVIFKSKIGSLRVTTESLIFLNLAKVQFKCKNWKNHTLWSEWKRSRACYTQCLQRFQSARKAFFCEFFIPCPNFFI